MSDSHRLLLVSGPSCAGKSPLCAAARAARPDLFDATTELVLYHSRSPRRHETDGEDYLFRKRSIIDNLRHREGFAVWDVRQDVQALELAQLDEALERGWCLYEGNFRIALDLQDRHRQRASSVFVSPLTRAEVAAWRTSQRDTFESHVTELMRRRLLRRAQMMKGQLGLPDLESIEARARDAVEGLRHAHRFDVVLPNHDGEDSDHWSVGNAPIGDARRSVEALCAWLEHGHHDLVETWDSDVVPRQAATAPARRR